MFSDRWRSSTVDSLARPGRRRFAAQALLSVVDQFLEDAQPPIAAGFHHVARRTGAPRDRELRVQALLAYRGLELLIVLAQFEARVAVVEVDVLWIQHQHRVVGFVAGFKRAIQAARRLAQGRRGRCRQTICRWRSLLEQQPPLLLRQIACSLRHGRRERKRAPVRHGPSPWPCLPPVPPLHRCRCSWGTAPTPACA